MESLRSAFEIERVAASPTTLQTPEGSFTLKLTGLRVERDPQGPYKPSRVLDLTVDDVDRSVSFPSRGRMSPWTWEVENESAVSITTDSTIMIQPYAARRFRRRKKTKRITITGDLVFRLFLANAKPGDRYDYEHAGVGFKMVLSFVAQDAQVTITNTNDPGSQTDQLGTNDQEDSHASRPTPDSIQSCLRSLKDLMRSLPPSTSETGEKAVGTLQKACDLASGNLDEDVGHLCEQVYKLLEYMQEPMFSGNLVSLAQTVKSTLSLVTCAAMFLEDYLQPKSNDLAKPAVRKPILDDFGRQLLIMKSSLDIGKDVSERGLPYTRKPTPSPSVSLFSAFYPRSGSGTRSETTNRGRDVGADLERLRRALHLEPTSANSLGLACLGRTRIDLLSNITAWLDDNSAPNILWLCGAPGTGKTTISWSLIEALKRQQRCASFFFFRQRKHTPSKLWRTLAFEMAKFHPAIESEIQSVVTNRTNDKLDLNDVEATFSKLVFGPLETTKSLLSGRDPVFLIDALDQCKLSQDNSWEMLLKTLLQWSSLPHHCKLIITSRPQSDIAKAFKGDEVKRMELFTGDSVDNSTIQDVRAYLYYRFAEMRRQDKSISDRWPNSDAVSKLVDHTKGSFKWAAVAVDSIQAARDKEKQLTAIIEGGTTTKLDDFDKYLEEVLKIAFEGSFGASERNSSDTYERSSSDAKGLSSDVFRETMGAIALSKQPLTMVDLKFFLQDHLASASEVSVEDVCDRLLSIISIEGEIKIRHNAYKDYLIDSKRCTLFDDAFHANAHRKMSILCLKIMQKELKFNICGFKSSYRMNNQVEDKDSLIKKCIPSYLAYACQYWADHLHGITAVEQRDSEIVYLLRHFLNTQLLYWLEVLSVLSKSHVAPKSLLMAAEWLEVSSVAMLSFRRYYRRTVAKDLSLLAADASRFSLTFADVISASAPHIYLSALPFAPPSSLVSKLYCEQFPHTIKVLHGEKVKWPAMRYLISTGDCVYDISIHPDGRRVAAAMRSGVAMVFSMTTGESLFHLSGHGGSVRTIAYGPSGKRIATGGDDGRLRIYEAENGSLLVGPFNLHPDRLRSVAWSPDGQRIVTGSDDRKVKVVVAETGQVIYNTAFHDGWVRTVLFTERFFISASDDRTVRIYNASTGTVSGEAWSTGKADYIRAIAISPDGKILAAGTNDHSIILYDTDTRKMIRKPIRGHRGAIRCLAFSRDGQQLASCSDDDQTVRLWDVSTGKKSCGPLHGNTSGVNSIKFSPDMKQLVTGGLDGSLRFFDLDSLSTQSHSGDGGVFRAATLLDDGNTVIASDGSSLSRWTVDEGHTLNVPFEGDSDHLAKIQSVSISPDGQLVATAGGNRTIIIWNAESGKISCGPFEGHADYIRGLCFSPDSTMVVSGSDDQKVSIWSVETGQRIHEPMEGHEAGVGEVCFSPDGKQIASGSYDNTAILWSVESGQKVHGPLAYHQDWICGLAYSPNGHYLATASDDYKVAIWDVTTGTRDSHVLTGHRGYVRVVKWSPDSKWIVTGARDNTIHVFDVETGSLVCKPLTGHTGVPTMLTLRSPLLHHDVEVVSASLDGTIRLWELGTKRFAETQTIPKRHRDWILSVAISPVQNHIASGGDDGRLIVADSITGEVKFSCDAHKCWIRCVTYSLDGAMIATCSDDSTVSIWDANDGSCLLGPFDCDVGAVLSIAFSPDGKVLISGNNDGTVRSWALNTIVDQLNPLITYRGHSGPVRTVACARIGDSERIVSGSDDAEIVIWDGDSDRLIRKFCGHDAAVLSISVSGDKVFSSSRDKTIRVWDLDTGDNISVIRGHTAPINEIKLSPDERWVVSASDDGCLRIWDSQTGKPLTLPLSKPSRILSVDISRDGNLIACAGADGQVHTWCPDLAQTEVWPDNLMRKMRGREYCPVDDQGILVDATLRSDGWLCGPMGQMMCWIPPAHRQGLLLQRAVSIVGARETAFDLRNFAHGTNWEQCVASN